MAGLLFYVQTSKALAICFQQYQTMRGMSAVPLNYLIDKNGAVADAWYGYIKDDGHLEASLKRLGF